jgi:hypothetical protein
LTEVLAREARCQNLAGRYGAEPIDVASELRSRKPLLENPLRRRIDFTKKNAFESMAVEAGFQATDSGEEANHLTRRRRG